MQAAASVCFEVSWEVANKVGGIYTVIKSKVHLMQEQYPEYYLIGPYIPDRSELEVVFQRPPEALLSSFEQLRDEGIECHYGTWQTAGGPKVILVDWSALIATKDDWRKFWWEEYQIDSLKARWDFDEPMLWSTAVGRLIEKIQQQRDGVKMVGHFHEWMSGFGMLWLKHNQSPVGTVFTTHATMLGRAISGSGQDLYTELKEINPEQRAKEFGVQEKFSAERACAQQADVFSTVSAATGIEAEKILGRKPDVLVLNGLDSDTFPTVEDLSLLHRDAREKMRNFFAYYFFPYENQQFDLEHTLAFFLVGRYEYRNKGIDLYLRALAELNQHLVETKSNRTVVAFVWVPAGISGSRMDVLESKNYFRQIRDHVEWRTDEIKQKIVRSLLSKEELETTDILSDEFLQTIRKEVWRFKRDGQPPLSTHYLSDEQGDAVLSEIRRLGLTNKLQDRVKVIFYPVYLDGHDGFLNLSYYDAMAACHLGVFPSYYEPWGYTPIESAAMGVPAITTDLAGCGMYLDERIKAKDKPGIWTLHRRGRTDEQATEELTGIFRRFVEMEHAERVEHKLAAKEAVLLADWKNLITNYITAHNLAMKKRDA